jgi:hypothetical protein
VSNALIRQANETHLKALEPNFPTAWENVNFSPTDAPFQTVSHLFAEPDDRGYRDSPFIQRGYMQIGLFYPTDQGPAMAQIKAEEIREHFPRGLSLDTGQFPVIVEKTPEIRGGAIEEGRYVIRVLVRFFANIDPTGNYSQLIDPEAEIGQEW